MAKNTLIWLILYWNIKAAFLQDDQPAEYNGFCINMFLQGLDLLSKLENCTIVIGNLTIPPMEKSKPANFESVSFPKLKEVTGYVALYRVFGLQTLGKLFPNLARIRGHSLFYHYALIVFDMAGLREIGLYNLLKIDRGGVIIWGNSGTCFIDTIDWNAIAPNARHNLKLPDREARCNFPCTCSPITEWNRCWNNIKCQRFLEGPEAENCSSKCLGCLKTNHSSCSLCRDYTFRGECVPRCPDETYVLAVSNYCLTLDECLHINHWLWDNKCVSDCPNNYVRQTLWNGNVTCVPCNDCKVRCGRLKIESLASIQSAEKCAYVDGYLIIHLWPTPQVVEELNYYLKNIEEVSHYIVINGSRQLTSLHFLSSLKRIKGEELYNGSHSLIIHDLPNLRKLFLPNVTENLKVDKGYLKIYRNNVLCMSEIEKLTKAFPVAPRDFDIPPGINGYGALCNEKYPDLKIDVKNETFAIATLYPIYKNDIHYVLLYVKISNRPYSSIAPEGCSDFDWHVINVPSNVGKTVKIDLKALSPATTYAICIEKYEPTVQHLSRSNITNFTTTVGKPEPPFILELVASSHDAVTINWINHLNYRPYIVKHELDVILLDITDNDIKARNHCMRRVEVFVKDYSRHAKIMRPPDEYKKRCESKCDTWSLNNQGAVLEEFFDICNTIKGCDNEIGRHKNTSFHGYKKSVAIDLNGQTNTHEVEGLLPYRDYKFHLRACTKDLCSISARGVVRTLHLENADVASIKIASANRSGFVYVQWEPPAITNGPLLSYTLEIDSELTSDGVNQLGPKAWCVLGSETNLSVTLYVTEKYLVRICSTTLANAYVCSEWKEIFVLSNYELAWWWTGMLFGAFLTIFSCFLGRHMGQRLIVENENIPLVDTISTLRQESEAPATMFSDFMPSNSILLSDMNFE